MRKFIAFLWGGKMNAKSILKHSVIGALTSSLLVACGGGGGGGNSGGTVTIGSGSSSSIVYYPYETLYGDVCATTEATPGCTFSRITGDRITVSEDPDYNYWGYGSDDMWFVQFNSGGVAAVYNEFGTFQYFADVADFAGYVGGTSIGVGITGLFWEDVRNGTYWLGKNGVLYNANLFETNYGKAINDQDSGDVTDTNLAALRSDSNKKLVNKAADRLVKEYGFQKEKAKVVASALNTWAVSGAERGLVTTRDMDITFKAVFGVNYNDALAAVKNLALGDNSDMRDVTERSAAALGLKPHEAQKFMKGMYKNALASWGFDVDSYQW